MDITVIWGAVIALAVFMYVLLDGFDLGIGILFPFMPSEDARDAAMNSVAPIWDGNETWLVLGGGGLLVAFPLAYSILLPAFYLPLSVMLIALIFRGVAFEFRFKVKAHKARWSTTFFLGSLVATFAQGLVLGSFVQGVQVEGRAFSGGAFDWLTPFGVATGAGLVAGYGLLGATWLFAKCEGSPRAWAKRMSTGLAFAVLLFMAMVSVWVPLLDAEIARRWFSMPNIVYLSPVPILIAVSAGLLIAFLRRKGEYRPFLMALALFLLGYLGLGISLWPNIVPPSVTLFEAAAPKRTQTFMLVGVLILLPIILSYTAYSYWIFRGKVRANEGYH